MYSWTSPMIKVRHGRDAKRRVYDKRHIGRVHEYFYHATEWPRFIGTCVHLELTMIRYRYRYRYGSLNIVMDPWKSLWSVQWPRHFTVRKGKYVEWTARKVSNSFSALLSCMITVFMGSSNVKFVIDSTLRVTSMTNFHIWTCPWIYI